MTAQQKNRSKPEPAVYDVSAYDAQAYASAPRKGTPVLFPKEPDRQ
jgi:hypothetical protein